MRLILDLFLQIQTSLVSGRPGLNTSSDSLRNFTKARFVRFRLQKMHKSERDLAMMKRLYYSIRGIAVGGQCICNGHASKCTQDKEGVSDLYGCKPGITVDAKLDD